MVDKEKKKAVGGSRLASKPKKKRSRLTGKEKVLITVAVVLGIALVVVSAWKALFVRPDISSDPKPPVKQESNTPAPEEPTIDYGEGTQPRTDGERKSEDYYTVLILGRDTGGGGNTDTMLLASYDVTNQKATVMSIPRDTMVNVSWDVKKINSVYNMNGGGEKGIQALYKEISQLVGFEPDFQVVVEWEAVGKLVDAIGGVYFDVPYTMDYHDPWQDLVIEQAKGYRLLTGEDAMQVIRWRCNDNNSPYGYHKIDGGIGDAGRMKVQQDFLKAVIKQMLTIQNMGNLNKIVQVFQESVETDLSFQNILWFGQKAVFGGLKVEDVEFLTMPWKGAMAWSRSYQWDLSYVVPIAGELLDVVNNKLSPFAETFALQDLDIMSVNADGSLRSSTGYVEDRQAALPPVRPEKTEEPEELPEDPMNPEEPINPDDPTVPENGENPEGGGTIVVDPEGNGQTGSETPEGETPVPPEPAPEPTPEPTPGPVPEPTDPAVPDEPVVEDGFIIIDPQGGVR